MDSLDLSDLTDLSSDEDYNPRGGKAKPRAKDVYVLKNALRPPRTVQYSAKYLYEQIIENHIDLNPEYQRDVVWPEAKQSGLIDSILRNYYIPPVIFSVNSQDDGTETRTCIDGKQRLTSIQRFFDGMISHKDSYTNQKLWYKGVRGATRKLLPQNYITLFANKQIVCVEYENLTEDQEREMFQRVQLGVALTPAERLQAITGPFPTLIREIQAMITSSDGFDDNMEWATTRGRDFQSIASVVYLIHKIPSQTFPSASTLDKWLQQQFPMDHTLEVAVRATFKKFISLVRNPKLNAPFTEPTRVSPVEFVMVGLLIFMLRTKFTDEEISQCIREMRSDVRGKHADVRSNTKVTKTMFAFINNFLQKKAGSKAQANSQKTKRKRDDNSDDEFEDHRPATSKPTLPTPQSTRTKTSVTQSQTPRRISTQLPSSSKVASSAKAPSTSTKKSAVAKSGRPKTNSQNPISKSKEPVKKEVKTSAITTPSSARTSSNTLPSTRSSGMVQPMPKSQPQPPTPTPTPFLSASRATPSAPSTSSSNPGGDVKKEPDTDIFAAIRQAKAKAANVKASIAMSSAIPVLPTSQSGAIECAPVVVQAPSILSTQPIITEHVAHIPVDGSSTAVSRTQTPVHEAMPNGPGNLVSENIMMLRNLSTVGAVQTSMDSTTTTASQAQHTIIPPSAHVSMAKDPAVPSQQMPGFPNHQPISTPVPPPPIQPPPSMPPQPQQPTPAPPRPKEHYSHPLSTQGVPAAGYDDYHRSYETPTRDPRTNSTFIGWDPTKGRWKQ